MIARRERSGAILILSALRQMHLALRHETHMTEGHRWAGALQAAHQAALTTR